MQFKEVNPEVFIADSAIVSVSDEDIAFIKKQAVANDRKRARICAHRDSSDTLHEMIIAIADSSYICPHKHNGKSESFHIIEGEVDVVIFDEDGAVVDVIELGPLGSGKNSFYRLSEALFHTVLVKSDVLVMHETTNGPFIANQTEMAPFAPVEADVDAAREYTKTLTDQVARYLEESR